MGTKNTKGFTLLEILLVVVAIGILASIVLVAINPQKQLAQVREAQIQSEQKSLQDALKQYTLDRPGSIPNGITTTRKTVCSRDGEPAGECLDLSTDLVPRYISNMPVETRYSVYLNQQRSRLIVDRIDSNELLTCPEGYISVPGSNLYGTKDFCVMKYHSKNVGGLAISQPNSTPWLNLSQTQAIAHCSNVGATLMSNAQWMTIARNIESIDDNWTGGSVGNGLIYRGHSDNNPPNALAASTDDSDGYFSTGNTDALNPEQRRTYTLSNGEVIWDFSGNIRHWLLDTIVGTDKPNTGATGFQEWTTYADGQYGTLSYENTRASDDTWNSSQGTGRYFVGATDTNTYVFSRGGNWNQTASVGIYNLNLNNQPGTADFGASFRCVIE